jgi:hypothetical protein
MNLFSCTGDQVHQLTVISKQSVTALAHPDRLIMQKMDLLTVVVG